PEAFDRRVDRDELRAHRADAAAERERKLLRAMIGELPVAVFLLERDGIVRRANRAACELVDVPAAYPVGKPFSVFVSPRDRGALRYAVSTAAAGVTGSPVRAELLARGRDQEAALWMAPLRMQGEIETLVALVALPAGPGAPVAGRLVPGDGAPTAAADRAPVHPDPAGTRGAHRLDVMATMTRLLLEPCADGTERMRRAAELLLRERLADWVVLDLADEPGGALARRLVAGPGAELAERIRAAGPPGPRTLPGRVAVTGRPELIARPEHPADLGRLPGQGSIGAALGATSLLAVPLLTRRGEPALGTVTLVRTGHPEYELGELGLLQQLAEHLALALGADRAAGGTRKR
ncbi:MAG TPA: PAS domain-containing protein, partial [Mycobacteriales bacterium]